MPDWLGMTFWNVFNTAFLIWAINKLPLKQTQINAVLWICSHEFLTTILSFQFNPIMTAIIILSFVFISIIFIIYQIKRKRYFFPTLLILSITGVFIIYGMAPKSANTPKISLQSTMFDFQIENQKIMDGVFY
jgi:hypothetical protein